MRTKKDLGITSFRDTNYRIKLTESANLKEKDKLGFNKTYTKEYIIELEELEKLVAEKMRNKNNYEITKTNKQTISRIVFK